MPIQNLQTPHKSQTRTIKALPIFLTTFLIASILVGCSKEPVGNVQTFEDCCTFLCFQKGNEWVFKRHDKLTNLSEELVDTIESIDPVANSEGSKSKRIKLKTIVKQTGYEAIETLNLTEFGLERCEVSGNILDPPMLILKFPISPNKKWTTNPTVQSDFGKLELKTNAQFSKERVTVPAGTFDAIVVTLENLTGKYQTWYVKGVGKVKQVLKGQLIDSEVELLSFQKSN